MTLQKSRNEYNRGHAAGLRTAIITVLGGECSRCHKVKDPSVLHIDHKKGGGTQHRKRVGSGPTYYKDILQGVSAGLYRLLCANCDRRIQYLQRTRERTRRNT